LYRSACPKKISYIQLQYTVRYGASFYYKNLNSHDQHLDLSVLYSWLMTAMFLLISLFCTRETARYEIERNELVT